MNLTKTPVSCLKYIQRRRKPEQISPENINKETEIIKRDQIEILELTSIITDMKFH